METAQHETQALQQLSELIKQRDVKRLSQILFDFKLSKGQEEIVRVIAYSEKKRVCISAMTRYGKTQCVAIGIGLYILMNNNKKVAFIAPQREQAEILMNYLTSLILSSPILLALSDLKAQGADRLRKEMSKRRMTFSNNVEYRIFSAKGDANRLMGFGANLIVKDESCLIKGEGVNAKIMRMMGDDPENAILVELFNPWDRDNKAFEHWSSGEYYCIHISWEQAVEEGRTTVEFVMEQKRELTPLEFTVLYMSEFPDQAEDSVFSLSRIEQARKRDLGLYEELKVLINNLNHYNKFSEAEVAVFKREVRKFTMIMAVDPADQGLDQTVMLWGVKKENYYEVVGSYSESKSESMELTGRVYSKALEFFDKHVNCKIIIDRIGIGAGPFSRLQELIREQGRQKQIRVLGAHFGEGAMRKDLYRNKKAENYFRAAALFEEEMISIPNIPKLNTQLIAIKWKHTSSALRLIVDPEEYSPDWADALVYFLWLDNTELRMRLI